MKSLDRRFRLFLYVLAADVMFGTVGFTFFERLPFVDASYLTVVTITTVGYGDITPVTGMGRVIAGALIITGVAAFTGVIATITESLVIAKEETFRREKLSIVLSVFYSEFGNDLIDRLIKYDMNAEAVRGALSIDDSWDDKRFTEAVEKLKAIEFELSLERSDLQGLLEFLESRTETLLRLLENPNLHKDSTLTDLLRAILHFKEELHDREDFDSLPDNDIKHLSGDAARAYRMLTLEWAGYLRYVKENYPYLFSLALRINPFKKSYSAVVQS
jgi:voltage-gated potassium channel